MYAAGKIPGSFFRREGRAGEKATLTARMIDRPLRPLFPKGWRRETQLVSIPMSIDHVHPYDILAMNGASAALMVSGHPVPVPRSAPCASARTRRATSSSTPTRSGCSRARSTWWSRAPRRPSSWSRPAPTRSRRPRSSTRSTSPTARSRSCAPPSASWPRRPASPRPRSRCRRSTRASSPSSSRSSARSSRRRPRWSTSSSARTPPRQSRRRPSRPSPARRTILSTARSAPPPRWRSTTSRRT